MSNSYCLDRRVVIQYLEELVIKVIQHFTRVVKRLITCYNF